MGERRGYTGVCVRNLRERDHFEDLVIDGRIILKSIFKKSVKDVDWVNLVQNRYRWWTLVIVMKLWVP